ncbi:MAG: lepB [Phycisphaerales bacterium]|nr:lepB [Phycisphaerales bacterium]
MADTTATKKTAPESSYKETVESVLVAFILAFIFRAFVVEAFVIPTGSMAPTLYGAHIRLQCPDCGYRFDVGYRGVDSANGEDVEIPSEAPLPKDVYCPNCGYSLANSAGTLQRVRFGDRILVLKYMYLFKPALRWDVVVFKSPEEGSRHIPEDPEYGQNYIKRLIGIGPETVVILGGDIYTGPPNADKPLGPDGKPLFHIQRKPAYVQDALWRNVYDNDFIPHFGADAHSWKQPWQEESDASGWTLNAANGGPSRLFQFNNPGGSGAIAFNPEANPDTHALADYLVYDASEEHDQGWRPTYVSDLKLACTYTRKSGDGPLRMTLTKFSDSFTAEFTPGKVRLLRGRRIDPNRPAVSDEREIKSASAPGLSGTEPARLELINVDCRVSVRIDGREVLATGADYEPDVNSLWQQEDRDTTQSDPFVKPLVRIAAERQSAALEHVQLSRDIYYLSHSGRGHFWGTTDRLANLKAGEYFVLGDNSYISGDARYWSDPVRLPREGLNEVQAGRVPERFMLGKAFFVYWPAGYPPLRTSVNAVPDFGEMRFIH